MTDTLYAMPLIDDANSNGYALACGDCRDVLRTLPDNSVDAIVTDPPYELGFMGKAWDSTGIAYDVTVWRECLRVLKPGGHLLAFGGSRTYHRLACAVEDAGFEIRDQIQWVYGSGFPKSHDVSKAIDRAAGVERLDGLRVWSGGKRSGGISHGGEQHGTEERLIYDSPATDAAREWSGWGTALKPAHEPIVMARKPLIGTVADNVQLWRTGAINVDACRVDPAGDIKPVSGKAVLGGSSDGWDRPWKNDPSAVAARERRALAAIEKANSLGRWPANLIHDGSDEVVGMFPNTGKSTGGRTVKRSGGGNVGSGKTSEASWTNDDPGYGDSGSAARFFYCAKASKRDRDDGLDGFRVHRVATMNAMGDNPDGDIDPVSARFTTAKRNTHPTVKPTDLMRYLCRLVTPAGGIVLDPFAGSGSTGKAARLEGFRFVGIELDPDHFAIAEARIAHVSPDAPAPNVNTSAQVYASATPRARGGQLPLLDTLQP